MTWSRYRNRASAFNRREEAECRANQRWAPACSIRARTPAVHARPAQAPAAESGEGPTGDAGRPLRPNTYPVPVEDPDTKARPEYEEVGAICLIEFQTARKPLILKRRCRSGRSSTLGKRNGRATPTPYRNTSLRNRFNNLPLEDAPCCDSVSVRILRRFRAHLTQFLHSSQLHLFQYVATFLGTLRYVHRTRRSDVITRARF
jgi:hypothetical protein